MEPRASSSLLEKKSENRARSATLLKMIFTSSFVIGGLAVDKLGTTETAREDELDELDEDGAAIRVEGG